MATYTSTMRVSSIWPLVAVLTGASPQACGCAGVGLSRLRPTEPTIHVGESFVATYEEGGSCDNVFTPVPNRVTWTSAETTVVVVESLTGRVTGKRLGDALVVPLFEGNAGPLSIYVHVR
jgi:hypothetical protein